jgi:hypothetical protein
MNEYKHVRFSLDFPNAVDALLTALEPDGWALARIVPYTQYESIAVFERQAPAADDGGAMNQQLADQVLAQLGPCPRGPHHVAGDVQPIAKLGGYGIGVLPCRACGAALLAVPLKVKSRGWIDRLALWMVQR